MSAATDFTEALALNWLLTSNTATRPTAWYVGLFTSATSDAGGGTEVSGNGYSRQAVSFTVATVSGTTKAGNSATITFPTATATWGTISYIAIFNASSGGNMLFHGPVVTNKLIETDDSFQITAGNLTVELQ
jgi:hypothetical protein